MADAGNPIFNQKAAERLRSPDDLDRYVQVTNPSVWVVLFACLALLAGLLIWGVFGTVSTSVDATAVSVNGQTMCFLTTDAVHQVKEGDEVNVNGRKMKIASVAGVPVSRNEASGILNSDYLESIVVPDEWAYQVILEGETDPAMEGIPQQANITTERIPPISLILNR